MPYENKELSRSWTIVFIGTRIDPGPKAEWDIMVKFEVTFPSGKARSISPTFTQEFIEEYFKIYANYNNERNRILEQKTELFKTWSLVRIEECINKNSLESEPKIASQNFEWAKKIENGKVVPSSQRQNDNTYIYILEKKIGF